MGILSFLFNVLLHWLCSLTLAYLSRLLKKSSFDNVKREVTYLDFIFQQEIYKILYKNTIYDRTCMYIVCLTSFFWNYIKIFKKQNVTGFVKIF
jgi:hypothetical protein